MTCCANTVALPMSPARTRTRNNTNGFMHPRNERHVREATGIAPPSLTNAPDGVGEWIGTRTTLPSTNA